ncbi:MAG: rod shape-determining protein MreD [Candidatus Omnitrophota bacterium]|nr:MAG: rod shape-determining protein MreD [Candidatus Omnitrophota bacterium]
MSKKTLSLVLLIFIASVQMTLLRQIKFFGVKPDLLLLSVVFFAFLKEKKKEDVFAFGLFAGLIKDGLSGNIWGVNTLAFFLLISFIRHYSQRLYLEHYLGYFFIAFLSSLFIGFFHYLLLYRSSFPCILLLPESIYTGIFAIPYFSLLKRAKRFLCQ